jgi:hypothetical protein
MIRSLFIKKERKKVTKKRRKKKRVHSELMKLLLLLLLRLFLFFLCFQFSLCGGTRSLLFFFAFGPLRFRQEPHESIEICHESISDGMYAVYIHVYYYTVCSAWWCSQETRERKRKKAQVGVPPLCNIHEGQAVNNWVKKLVFFPTFFFLRQI